MFPHLQLRIPTVSQICLVLALWCQMCTVVIPWFSSFGVCHVYSPISHCQSSGIAMQSRVSLLHSYYSFHTADWLGFSARLSLVFDCLTQVQVAQFWAVPEERWLNSGNNCGSPVSHHERCSKMTCDQGQPAINSYSFNVSVWMLHPSTSYKRCVAWNKAWISGTAKGPEPVKTKLWC